MQRASGVCFVVGLVAASSACGDAAPTLLIERRTEAALAGGFMNGERLVEFSSRSSGEHSGNVLLRLGDLTYRFDYDYAAGHVVSDAQGRSLDRPAHRLLSDAVPMLSEYLGPQNPELPLHEQMLYAALVTWQESGGMPLERTRFELAPEPPAELDKSIGNDGVGCIRSGLAYLASFDYGDAVILDRVVTAGEFECNGMCGPYCIQLQPWKMWTLDCLEHDECCRETDDDTCWTPLGECGDEYGYAQTDFLRGFDPFRRHCGG